MFHAIQFARVFFPLHRNTSSRNSLRQGYNYCRNGTDEIHQWGYMSWEVTPSCRLLWMACCMCDLCSVSFWFLVALDQLSCSIFYDFALTLICERWCWTSNCRLPLFVSVDVWTSNSHAYIYLYVCHPCMLNATFLISNRKVWPDVLEWLVVPG